MIARIAMMLPCLVASTLAWGQDAVPREQLADLASIEAVHDLCGFDLSDAQQDVITKRRQALVDDGAVSEQDVSTIQDDMMASMRRQVSDGLCRPEGAEAKLYKRMLADLGSP